MSWVYTPKQPLTWIESSRVGSSRLRAKTKPRLFTFRSLKKETEKKSNCNCNKIWPTIIESRFSSPWDGEIGNICWANLWAYPQDRHVYHETSCQSYQENAKREAISAKSDFPIPRSSLNLSLLRWTSQDLDICWLGIVSRSVWLLGKDQHKETDGSWLSR